MRAGAAILVLLLAAAAAAEELTVAEVVAAHRAGAPVEGILRLIRDAPAVVTPSPADLARLRDAGVPEEVIRAMVAHTAPAPTAAPSRPDDPRLADVVRLMRAGLSDALVCEQVRRSGVRYEPSANDLVYLKENKVSDAVIEAVMASGVPPPTTPPAAVLPPPRPTQPASMTFEPLVRMTGAFRKRDAGRLVLAGDQLEWTAATDPARVERTPTGSLHAVWLATTSRAQGPPLVELRVRTAAGDDMTFRDADAAAGGSAQVTALLAVLRQRFPAAVLGSPPAR